MILQWLTSAEWTNVVKALLHTLWQGAVVAVLLGLILRRLDGPVSRYRCSFAALAGVMFFCLITWAVLNRPIAAPISDVPAPAAQVAAAVSLHDNSPTVVVNFAPINREPSTMGWTAWLALFWLSGAVIMTFRAGFQIAGAERLRRSSRSLDDIYLSKLLMEARRAVGLVRQVRLTVTEELTSPAVVGVLVPTLILPLSLTTTLTPEQIRFVLLHELAHIRRGDYFANLFQLFAEALLFFNPAVWWISRQIRLEREACCDALAIELSGAPADYARTLVHVAENVLNPVPAAALAFGNEREPSSLTDRVQRLLVPGYRSLPRLTWRAMLASLFVGTVLLTLSAIGTRVTVAAILSPQQRIDRIEKKMTELGQKPVAGNFYDENAPKVKISGIIRTADGLPVPKWVDVNIHSEIPRSSYGVAISAKNGKFSGSIRAGMIQLGASAEGFAPVTLGPLNGLETNRFENLEIILDRGFDATLQVMDTETGKPLPDARIESCFLVANSGFNSHRTNTDATGSVVLPHCSDLPLDVTVNASGYEITRKHFDHVRAGNPLRVALRRGEPVSGMVLDKMTGKPIAGAEVHLIYQAGGENDGHHEWNGANYLLGRSDANGNFNLNQLRGGVRYWLGVSAPGHESVLVNSVVAGTKNLAVQLGPELIVRGHVKGSLDGLQVINSDHTLGADWSEVYENNSVGHNQWVVLHETNGVVTFAFTNPIAATVTLSGVNGFREEREVTAPIDDWVVDFSNIHKTETEPLPKREVIFRFKNPSGVLPRGTVEITIPDSLDIKHRTAHEQEFEITNGEVHAQIAIGGKISIEPKHMVGYTFNHWGKWASPTGESGDWLGIISVISNPAPLVIEIPLIPAGAIYAYAKNADGTPAGGLFFGVTEIKPAPGRDQNGLGNDSDSISSDAPRKWVSGPLPLGGTYQINGWRGNSFCVSQPIRLTEENPDAEVELQFPSGKTFSGIVLDANGNPLRDVELKVSFSLADNHGFTLKSVMTDGRGRFDLENMTPDVGTYSFDINAPNTMAEKVKLNFKTQPQIIRLQRGHTLAGRVVEAGTGFAIPGTEVRAWTDNGRFPTQTTHTDADGHFEFTTLGDAAYTLFIDAGQCVSNEKYRTDAGTNLMVSIKLYEWSKLKPKAPDASVNATNVPGVLANTNLQAVIQPLKQRIGGESLVAPEVMSTSGRGENKIKMPNISVPVSVPASQRTVTFRVDQRIRSEELKSKLLEAGVSSPPTTFFYKDSGMLLVRGSEEQMARVNRLVLKLNGYPTNETESASKDFPPAENTMSGTNLTTTNLFTRTFKVDPHVFAGALREQTGLQTTNVLALTRNFFSMLGVDLESSKDKTIFYNDRIGVLFVKATEADLDMIDRAIMVLDTVPPQIHIKARFLEVSQNDLFDPVMLTNYVSAPITGTPTNLTGILNDKNFRTLLGQLESKPGVEILAESEVITTSGRQTQMRATQVVTVVTNLAFQELAIPATNRIVPQTATVEIGAVLDVVPYVLADGYTINLSAIPSITDFLGYEKNTNTTAVYTKTGEKVDLPKILPNFRVRQAAANLNLWDNQTMVFTGLNTETVQVTKDKVPFFGDLPLMGKWFQSESRSTIKKKMFIFITVTIVDPAGNRVHSDDELSFAKTGVSPQPK